MIASNQQSVLHVQAPGAGRAKRMMSTQQTVTRIYKLIVTTKRYPTSSRVAYCYSHRILLIPTSA